MNPDQALKIQAYLDGELPPAEAQQVAQMLAGDAPAQALFEELQCTRRLLAANEPELTLPESREFFWSKIEREIRRQEKETVPAPAPVSIWRMLQRYLVPISAAAVVAFVGMVALNSPPTFDTASHVPAEMESLNEEMGSISFRSESDRMTVIYLYDRTTETSGSSDESSFQ